MHRHQALFISSVALALAVALPPSATTQERSPRPREEPRQPATPALTGPGDTMLVVLAKGLKARAIGPAVMGGRVSSIALDPRNPYTWYVGLGTGGVMKTTDNGGTFVGLFERERVAAIGAISVAPSDSSVVWVGTGEANDRNSSGWGDGVYRSTDGGASWKNVGLRHSMTIARIAVHPTDPKTVYVAAMGDLWGPSAERGCYRTTDGGATWKAVLQAPAPYTNIVGCGDLALDPTNPNTVYAALYARRRQPWSFTYGVALTNGTDVGGIYKSTDGGATWKKLTNGLPTQTGRIGLAVYAKTPSIVYAVVQSDEGGTQSMDQVRSRSGGVFRSGDGGASWTRMSALDPRPFYFSQIRIDPTDDKRIYVLGFALHVSEDGGRTWREDRFGKVHPDNHALVIDPAHPQRLLIGNDGGVYQSYDGGAHWAHANRFAGGEFYRVSVDSSTPYRICGGLQDNENWVGPSRTQSKEGIRNSDWTPIEGGDGFYCVFDPDSLGLLYAESQTGVMHRIDLKNGEVRILRPEPAEGQPGFRFNWNSPLIGSRQQRGTIYLAGNRVFELTDHGERWRAISPDLTTQNVQRILTTGSGAEAYGVVFALAESPVKAGMLWAGTDDGKLWVTEDGGGHWTDLTATLPPSVKGEWISRIEPGHHDPNVAYLTVDAHRSQRYEPFAFRTADRGRTWQPIAANLPKDEPVKVIREDLVNPDLLFAGTEFGLWVSADRGRHWGTFGRLPTVTVDDILIHPRDGDLVIATHGRSLYIVDDITPLRELAHVRDQDVYLFPPKPAQGSYPLNGWVSWGGSAVYRGENPPSGAVLTYYIKQASSDPVTISIATATGQPVAALTGAATPGLNRVTWDLMPTSDVLNDYGGEGKRFVPSGDYTVTLTYGGAKQTQTLSVRIAPGIETR